MPTKDDSLKKIIATLDRLERGQQAICERLGAIEGRPGSDAASLDGAEKALAFLDQFRAGESLGAASLGAWIGVCGDDALRGSVRVIEMRESFHARLLEERIKALGGSVSAEIPEAQFAAVMESTGGTKMSDAQKLQGFVAQFPDCDAALAPIFEQADALDGDPETQALLRTIAQDERSTLECLAAHCERLSA
jgi:hypothetical protein